MTDAELIAKIKAEIDKRYAEYREKMKSNDFTYYEGMADALDLFEQFLDTLESEKPSEDLEEAAKKFVGYDMDCDELRDYETGIASFIAGAEWQKEQMMAEWLKDRDGCFWDGVNEGKKAMREQMMEEAVEGEVCIPNVWAEHKEGKELVVRAEISKGLGFKFGDKVRIIIVKED